MLRFVPVLFLAAICFFGRASFYVHIPALGIHGPN